MDANKKIKSAFPDILSDLINNSGKTLREIARESGVGPSQLSAYQSGTNEPNMSSLVKLSAYFDVSVDWLIGRPNNTMSKKEQVLNACKYTGLSEKAINRILLETALYPGFTIYENNMDLISVLNLLLTSTHFWGLANQLRGYINSPKRIESRSAEIAREFHEVNHGVNMDDEPNERDVFGWRAMRAFNSLMEELDGNESGVENNGKH